MFARKLVAVRSRRMPRRARGASGVTGWRAVAAVGDAVIVRQGAQRTARFVVHGSCGPQLDCASYAEAEAHAASYAEHAHASVWYAERGRLQLVFSFVRRTHS